MNWTIKDSRAFVRAVVLLAVLIPVMDVVAKSEAAGAGQLGDERLPARPDLYIQDTPSDTGLETNPDGGPMWISDDVWVRNDPISGYRPNPFTTNPTWLTPANLSHQDPEYRDPKFSKPNYVYVRVRNRGTAASLGTEELHVYWAKASTGLGWPTQWGAVTDYMDPSCSTTKLCGAELTKPRKNAATASSTERDAYRDAIIAANALYFGDGVSYWHKQNDVHKLPPMNWHGNPRFLPWHREFINRYEILLQEAKPGVTLLYWDWTTDPRFAPPPPSGLFTSTFMGNSTGAIGPPFNVLAGPPVTRGVPAQGSNCPSGPPGVPDLSLLATSDFYPLPLNTQAFGGTATLMGGTKGLVENPSHDCSHVYIGGPSGNMSNPTTSPQDPFFFMLHANVDRLWAQWQRDPSHLQRLDPATTYDNASSNVNLTTTLAPWDGNINFPLDPPLFPWTVPGGYIVAKNSKHPSIVSPPIYDTAPLVIPILQPGETVVIQIPWYPPNPADYLGTQSGHFCLLARITGEPMTFPEGLDVNANTKNNNNIAWKNLTVVDNLPGSQRVSSVFVRNVVAGPVQTGLRFVDAQGQAGTSVFASAHVYVDLPPVLLQRWRAGGSVGERIRVVNGRIELLSSGASIRNIMLNGGETFPVDVLFSTPQKNFAGSLSRGRVPLMDVIQIGTPADPNAIVGGIRFQLESAPGRPPGVAFTSPANGTLFQTNSGIPIEIKAGEFDESGFGDRPPLSISLFSDDVLLATVSHASSLSFVWQGAVLGSHRLRAVAVGDNLEEAADWTTVTVVENTPPTATLVSPRDGEIFQVGETISLNADASDPGGGVDHVRFFLSDAHLFTAPQTLVGIATTSPYTVSLAGLAPGHYMLIAVAVDNRGATSPSLPVHFEVAGLHHP